jgi:VWFA-related protein
MSPRTRVSFVLPMVALAAAVVATATGPQQGDQAVGRFVDRSDVAVVSFEVTVHRKEDFIKDLTRDDFEVFHDGQRVELSNFASYTRPSIDGPLERTATPSKGDTPTAVTARTAEPTNLCLFLDNENITPASRAHILVPLQEFARKRLAAGDRVMVVTYEHRPRIVQALTSDPERVVEALGTLNSYLGNRLLSGPERASVSEFGSVSDRFGSMSQGIVDEQWFQLCNTTRAIRSVIISMAGLPGRKALVYISDGLPMQPGAELFEGKPYRPWRGGGRAFLGDLDGRSQFSEVATVAAASGVTIHAVDARGLIAPPCNADQRLPGPDGWTWLYVHNYQEPLRQMTEQTGGTAVLGNNDYADGFARISSELSTYYLLGYALPPRREGAIHDVEVQLKRAGTYQLNYRRRFVEKSLPMLFDERVEAGLNLDLDDNPLGVTAVLGAPTRSEKSWQVPVKVAFPIDRVALLPIGNDLVGRVTVQFVTNRNGRRSEMTTQEHEIRVPKADYETAKTSNWPITASLLVNPGPYRLSVGVRDEATSLAGFAVLNTTTPE